jgi:predicted RND superfamily exporter protein
MNRAMNGGRADAYRIPDSRDLIAQYLLLLGPDDLKHVLSPDGRTAGIYALARSDDVAWVEGLFAKLRKVAAGRFPPNVRVGIAGGELAQSAAVNDSVVREKIENMVQVSLVIVLLSALVFRSLTAGLLVLAPLVCAALVNVGAMGWVGSDLSFATATYTAMGVSLGADFAIYLLFRLREEARLRPLREAVDEALRTSGRAVFFVASAIAAGNAVLFASNFLLWRELGGYVALMMTTSCLATLTLLPALVLRLQPRFLRVAAEAAPLAPAAKAEAAERVESTA